MPFSENLAKATGQRSATCDMGRTLEQLPAEEVKAVEEALDNREISGSVLSRALKAEGYSVSAYSVRRHRRGECAC